VGVKSRFLIKGGSDQGMGRTGGGGGFFGDTGSGIFKGLDWELEPTMGLNLLILNFL